MSKFFKWILLLLPVLLSFSSPGEESYEKNHPEVFSCLEAEVTEPAFAEGKSTGFCLFGSGEIAVSPPNSFPAPASKYQSKVSSAGLASVEIRIQQLSSQYLLHSGEIIPGLSVRDIIYPFHYFW